MSSTLTADLTRSALQLASRIRRLHNFGALLPVPVFDLCDQLGLTLQHVDFSMEGMYVKNERSILISSLRPVGRQAFTCAHELGHHFFEHATSFDKLSDRKSESPEEILADAFAGFLLMPILGIRKAFTDRGWSLSNTTAAQIYIVACQFGVGYDTLVSHLAYSTREMDVALAAQLRKKRLPAIRKEICGLDMAKHLIVLDEHWSLPTVDLEIGSKLLVPSAFKIGSRHLSAIATINDHTVYEATLCGISQLANPTNSKSLFVRICKAGYVGFNENRFLEEDDEDIDDYDQN